MSFFHYGLIALAALVLLSGTGGSMERPPDEQRNAVTGAPRIAGETGSTNAQSVKTADGRALFQAHCAVCHPGGGNVINPQKTLDGESLSANGIETVGEIIDTMRNPGPGMTRFDKNILSDRQAAHIAEYILQTY